jgi:23S rRNA pseudouridine1911/1915/1917 synthase
MRASRLRLVVLPCHDGSRLDQFLASATTLSRRRVRGLIEEGVVSRNQRPLQVHSRLLRAGDVVDVAPAPGGCDEAFPAPPRPEILFEDRWILVANKPAGVLSQSAESRNNEAVPFDQQVLWWLAAREGRRPFLRLVHRIDRLASGAIIFARNPQALKPLSQAWAGRRAHRLYLAVVAGSPTFDDRTVEAPIARDYGHVWRFRVDPAGKPARTQIRVLEHTSDSARAVLCQLDTGRTHQIRVHLASIGHPIVGDALYGGPHLGDRLLLHAAAVRLPHPRDGSDLVVIAPLPQQFTQHTNWQPREDAFLS